MRYLIFILFVTACSGGSSQSMPDTAKPDQPSDEYKIIVSESNNRSTWWNLEPWSEAPKYSGAFGTYTYKHIPVAVSSSDHTYQVYGDNTSGKNKIMLIKDDGDPIEIHESTTDNAHTNAVVHVDGDGFVHVIAAAQGTKVKGAHYRSVAPHSTDFEFLGEHDFIYPQPHDTLFGHALMHSDYHYSDGRYTRRLMMNGKVIVKGAHYQITEQCGGYLYSVYNSHPNGNVDKRRGLHVIRYDGETWSDTLGIEYSAPMDDGAGLVYDSNLIYLKEAKCHNGELKVLFVESTSAYPTEGVRHIKEWSNGSIKTIIRTHHNYASAAYVDGLILATIDGGNYVAGDIVAIKDGEVVATKPGNYSYIRPVRNGAGAVVSSGASDINAGAYHHQLKLVKQ